MSDPKQSDLGLARQQIENRIEQGHPIPPNMAVEAIMGGYAPSGMTVEGTVYLSHRRLPVTLPEVLTAERVELSHASGVKEIPTGWTAATTTERHASRGRARAPARPQARRGTNSNSQCSTPAGVSGSWSRAR